MRLLADRDLLLPLLLFLLSRCCLPPSFHLLPDWDVHLWQAGPQDGEVGSYLRLLSREAAFIETSLLRATNHDITR